MTKKSTNNISNNFNENNENKLIITDEESDNYSNTTNNISEKIFNENQTGIENSLLIFLLTQLVLKKLF